MKTLALVAAIGVLMLALLPGMVWAAPGKQPTAREQVGELCATPVWAQQVLSFDQGLRLDGEPVLAERSNPSLALGAPDELFVSLGFKGSITVSFGEPIPNNPGPNDLYILVQETTWFDVSPDYPLERAKVYVIVDGKEHRARGFVTSKSNGTGLGIVTIPNKLDHVDGVKLVDKTDSEPFLGKTWEGWYNADAYDLDAVGTCSTDLD